jgi:uncharacterized delta-60 repeat protein
MGTSTIGPISSSVSDGLKIIIAGQFNSWGEDISPSTSVRSFIVLNSGNTLDNTIQRGKFYQHPGRATTLGGINNIQEHNNKLYITWSGWKLSGGTLNPISGTPYNAITRLNSDGSIDTSFTCDTYYNIWFGNESGLNFGRGLDGPKKLVFDDSDKIYCISPITRLEDNGFGLNNSIDNIGIFRLNSDGSIDNGFAITASTYTRQFLPAGSPRPYDLHILNDNLYLFGDFDSFRGSTSEGVVIINTDGSINTSFGSGVVNGSFERIRKALRYNNDFICFGQFTSINGIDCSGVIKITSGITTVDMSFSGGTGFSPITGGDGPYDAEIDEDGNIIVVGVFTSYDGNPCNNIVKLNPDGSFNSSFGSGFTGTLGNSPSAFGIRKTTDNNFIIWGEFLNFNGVNTRGFIKIDKNGTILRKINALNFGGSPITTAFERSDKKLFLGVSTPILNSETPSIVGIKGNGNRYSNFKATNINIPREEIDTVGIDSNDNYYFYNQRSKRLIKLDYAGNLVSGFTSEQFGSFPSIYTITEDQDKILLGGTFTSYSGITHNRVIRLNPDATVDNSFLSGDGFSSTVRGVLKTKDDSLLFFGQFINYSGLTVNRIVKLKEDGTIDTNFNMGLGFSSTVWDVTENDDGDLYCVGQFTSYSGVTFNKIVKLNGVTASIDNSFNPGIGFTGAATTSVEVDNNGDIIVGGIFSAYSGVTVPGDGQQGGTNFIKLHPDGSIDQNFLTNIGTGFSTRPKFKVSPENKIYCVSNSSTTTFNGNNINGIIKLNNDGTIDTTFENTSINPNIDSSIKVNDIKLISTKIK